MWDFGVIIIRLLKLMNIFSICFYFSSWVRDKLLGLLVFSIILCFSFIKYTNLYMFL